MYLFEIVEELLPEHWPRVSALVRRHQPELAAFAAIQVEHADGGVIQQYPQAATGLHLQILVRHQQRRERQ